MKVSEIGLDNICTQCRIMDEDIDETERVYLGALLTAARAYVRSYTGLSDAEIDTYDDLAVAVLVLISDMYDNRQNYVDKSNINRVVDTILNLHAVNLLPSPEVEDGT